MTATRNWKLSTKVRVGKRSELGLSTDTRSVTIIIISKG